VDRIITDLGVFDIYKSGMRLTELAPDVTVEEVKQRTEGAFKVADDLIKN